MDLSKENHVISNFSLACTQKNLSELDRMLAPDFRFYFWDYEVEVGLVDSISWGKGPELTAVGNLFEAESTLPKSRVEAAQVTPTWGRFKDSFLAGVPSWMGGVRLTDLQIYQGEQQWTPAQPLGSGKFFKDIWYYFEFESESQEYPFDISSNARLVIEQQEVDGQLKWLLVEWFDRYER